MLQIVDIALKAISPAVNDPTTAITSIDQLSRILIRFVSREPISPLYFDPPGVLRVSFPGATQLSERILDQAHELTKASLPTRSGGTRLDSA